MEIIVSLLVLGVAVWWIFFRDMDKDTKDTLVTPQKDEIKEAPAPAAEPAPAPVVEVPTAPVCGCGRSPTGFCVGLHKLSADEWAVHADNPNKVIPVKAVEEPKPVAKKPAAKKTAGAKPAAKKAKPAARTAKPKKA